MEPGGSVHCAVSEGSLGRPGDRHWCHWCHWCQAAMWAAEELRVQTAALELCCAPGVTAAQMVCLSCCSLKASHCHQSHQHRENQRFGKLLGWEFWGYWWEGWGCCAAQPLLPGSAANMPQHHPSVVNGPLQCQVKEEENGTERRGSPTSSLGLLWVKSCHESSANLCSHRASHRFITAVDKLLP